MWPYGWTVDCGIIEQCNRGGGVTAGAAIDAATQLSPMFQFLFLDMLFRFVTWALGGVFAVWQLENLDQTEISQKDQADAQPSTEGAEVVDAGLSFLEVSGGGG